MEGIRAEVVLENPAACPVAAASDGTDENLTDVTWTGYANGTVTEQVTATIEPDIQGATQVFDYGEQAVYEFEREGTEPCACEFVEETAGPVTDVHSRDGSLHLTMHVRGVELLRTVIAGLREEFGPVSVEYLIRSRDPDREEPAIVPVDLGNLTDRQQEVVETAHEMGYFAYPRQSNAGEVATALGIEPSTLAEHLAAAQSKILSSLLARS
ncbi:MAG: helix-turn-helix domain-containing protein [Haloarculaceae archaeon]